MVAHKLLMCPMSNYHQTFEELAYNVNCATCKYVIDRAHTVNVFNMMSTCHLNWF